MAPTIGDVIEIPTPVGLAYAQYTHRHPRYGALLRVLPEVFETRPEDLAAVVQRRERFHVFFPLAGGLNDGIVRVIDHIEVPAVARSFPLFRSGVRNPE